MCAVSVVTDYEINRWANNYHKFWELPNPDHNNYTPNTFIINSGVSKEEFEAFKKEFLEFKELVKSAIKFDENSDQPHCEVDEKVAIVKKVAEQLSVNMEDVFPNK